MSGEYQRAFDAARDDPEGFWGEAAKSIHWDKPFDRVLEPEL